MASRLIENAPGWLSTELRDGPTQFVSSDPMEAVKNRTRRFFDLLVGGEIGIKEIESWLFPGAGVDANSFSFSGLVFAFGSTSPMTVTVQCAHPEPRRPDPHSFDQSRRRACRHRPPVITRSARRGATSVFSHEQGRGESIAIAGAKVDA